MGELSDGEVEDTVIWEGDRDGVLIWWVIDDGCGGEYFLPVIGCWLSEMRGVGRRHDGINWEEWKGKRGLRD